MPEKPQSHHTDRGFIENLIIRYSSLPIRTKVLIVSCLCIVEISFFILWLTGTFTEELSDQLTVPLGVIFVLIILMIIPVDTSIVGVWNYTIQYNDSAGLWGIPHTVIITVEQESKGGIPGFEFLFGFIGLAALVWKYHRKKAVSELA